MLSKLEKILFYLFLFSVPLQARKILFYREWYFNEWQSISLYATDLFIIVLLVFWLYKYLFKTENLKFKIARYDYFLIVFLGISVISLKNSSDFYLSLYQRVKLGEFTLFYFYLKNYAFYRFNFLGSFLAVILGGLCQATIAIIQFFKQSDIGLQKLGESVLSVNISGVAVFFNSIGQKVMRVYGLTPHPNILATFLFLAIFAFYFLYLYKNQKDKKIDYGFITVYVVLLFAFLLTFSRTIIFFWVLGFAARTFLIGFNKNFRHKYWEDRRQRQKLVKILVSTLVILVIFSIVYWPDVISRIKISGDEEAVQLRLFYAEKSLESKASLFGVGIGNFVNCLMIKNPNIPRSLFQPVHNIYLLIYRETGVLGILAFALFIIFLIKDFILKTKLKHLYDYSFLIVFLSLLLIGFFDHFLWTLQQGRIMFWAVLALISFKGNGIIKT